MAKGIIDCKGQVINIGDKVQTEYGDVIEVCGGLVNEHRLFNAHKCTVVPATTPLTNTGEIIPGKTVNPGGPVGPPVYDVDMDCVVWGT